VQSDRKLSISVSIDLSRRLKKLMKSLKAANAALRHLDQRIDSLKRNANQAAEDPSSTKPPPPVKSGLLEPTAPLLLGPRYTTLPARCSAKLVCLYWSSLRPRRVRTPLLQRARRFVGTSVSGPKTEVPGPVSRRGVG
jgi:hypothetical protein